MLPVTLLPQLPHTAAPGLWALATASSLLGLTVIVVAFGGAWAERRLHLMQRLTRGNLTWVFVTVWLLTFAVYLTGMYTGQPISLLGNAPMAVIHAFGAFVLASDVSAIVQPYVGDWVFMAAFSVVHFAAAAVSMLFVVKHFGYALMSRARLASAARWGRPKDTTYIFWGWNSAAHALARDIRRHDEGDYRLVVVHTPHNGDTGDGLNRLLGTADLSDDDLEQLQGLDCLSITATEGDSLPPNLLRLIKNKTLEATHIFVLDDDEASNLQAAQTLRGQTTENTLIYCRARNNDLNCPLEDSYTGYGAQVRLIDTSHIGVELLKDNPDALPVQLVDVQPDASVSSPFRALVMGCSEVGRDAMAFLYEYAAFMATGTDGQRSAFSCHVVDREMSLRQGALTADMPGLMADPAVTFEEADCRSEAFIKKLKLRLPGLNYIVVALGDDALNMATAIQCLYLAQRYRDNLNGVRIMVHIGSDPDGRYRRAALHHNRLIAAQACAPGRLHQDTLKADDDRMTALQIFGLDSDIFTYDAIVNQRMLRMAQDFKTRYDISLPPDWRQTWAEEEAELRQTAVGKWQGCAPTLSAIRRLRRVQSQNLANSLHARTKRLLALKALGPEELENLKNLNLRRPNEDTSYTSIHGEVPTHIQAVLDTLARTEHLRWIASHTLLGYLPADDVTAKDEVRLQHGCMAPWTSMTPQLQAYDYNVVDVTLDINTPEQ